MLLGEIIKDLSKDLENSKQAIAAVCVAEKNMQRLLDTVNESMSINDIRNCYEVIFISIIIDWNSWFINGNFYICS